MLMSVSLMKENLLAEIERMKQRTLTVALAHHLMVLALRSGALPASQLPKVIEAYDDLDNPEFSPRSAWALFNAFTATIGQRRPWQQMDGTLRLTKAFREGLSLH